MSDSLVRNVNEACRVLGVVLDELSSEIKNVHLFPSSRQSCVPMGRVHPVQTRVASCAMHLSQFQVAQPPRCGWFVFPARNQDLNSNQYGSWPERASWSAI